ncbi:MAG: hypothetical protein WD602_01630 [Actinomycetota bacterium]
MSPGDGASRSYPDLGGTFTPLYRRLQELGLAKYVTHVGKIGPRGRSADFFVEDRDSFIAVLKDAGQFCEDTPAGRILHRGKACWREDTKARSLHIAIGSDGHVTAHLDRYSPVARARKDGLCRYSPGRIAVHNAARVIGDLVRFLFGHRVDCAPLLLSLRGRRGPDLACVGEPPDPEGGPEETIPFGTLDEAVDGLDHPEEPWTIHWEIHLTGRLDPVRLRESVQAAVSRHPLARARKDRSSAGAARWAVLPGVQDEVLTVVDCSDEATLSRARNQFLSVGVPLTMAPPFRLLLARRAAGDVLVMNVNHVAGDSFGALRLLRSVSRAYAGKPDPEHELGPVWARTAVAAAYAGTFRARTARFRVLLRKLGDLLAVPARIAPDRGRDVPGYGIHLEEVRGAPELLAEMNDREVNDYLVAALHLAVAVWNIERGVRCGRVSILMPVNLRPDSWVGEVFANLSVLARTLTKPSDRSLHRVLNVVGAQTAAMSKDQSLVALVELVGQDARLPGPLRRALPALVNVTGNRLVDTAALAFVGRVEADLNFGAEAGEVEGVWFSPPARMPLGVSVGAVFDGTRLNLAFRYRHPLMNGEAVCRFSDHYLNLLSHLIDENPQPLGDGPD